MVLVLHVTLYGVTNRETDVTNRETGDLSLTLENLNFYREQEAAEGTETVSARFFFLVLVLHVTLYGVTNRETDVSNRETVDLSLTLET